MLCLQSLHLFLRAQRVSTPSSSAAGLIGCVKDTVTARQAHILALIFRAGGGSAGITAKDALGNDVKASEWLKSHPAGDHNLVQGLKVLSCVQLLHCGCHASASHSQLLVIAGRCHLPAGHR